MCARCGGRARDARACGGPGSQSPLLWGVTSATPCLVHRPGTLAGRLACAARLPVKTATCEERARTGFSAPTLAAAATNCSASR